MNIVFEKLDKLRRLKIDLKLMQDEAASLHKYIQENCTHPDYAWTKHEKYNPSCYDHVAYTTTWEQCSICGKKRSEKDKYA